MSDMFERGEITREQWESPAWESFVDTNQCSSGCVLSGHQNNGYCYSCKKVCVCNVKELITSEVKRWAKVNSKGLTE